MTGPAAIVTLSPRLMEMQLPRMEGEAVRRVFGWVALGPRRRGGADAPVAIGDRGRVRWIVPLLVLCFALLGLAGSAQAAAGTILTVAGNGTASYSGDGGAATSAQLFSPQGVAVDAGGDQLIADTYNNRVRLVAAASCSSGCPYGLASMTKGDIYTIAGNGTKGYSGDGGAATSAELDLPSEVAVDAAGDLLIADAYNQRVRLVAAASCSSGCPYGLTSMTKGDIYTIAGSGTSGYSGDGGPATSAAFRYPSGVGVDAGGDLLIADTYNNRVRLVAAVSCSSGCPYGLASMTKGDIYTVAGDGTDGYSGDSGAATSAELGNPFGMAVDAGGDLLIGDNSNQRVRLVAAASCSSGCPYGLASMTKGDIYTVVGDGIGGYSGDGGPATSAHLNLPTGVGVDAGGDLLIADSANNRVRLVAAADCASGCPYGLASMTKGDIYTVAGDGTSGYTGDSGPATSAELSAPLGVAVDARGDLLIADYGNNAVRLVIESVASPSVSVSAPASGTAGSAISGSSIVASLSGGSFPSGTMTFKVFGPQTSVPTSCTSGGSTVGTASVSGNGSDSPSAGFTPSSAGDYWWYATYGGDSHNNPAASTCGAGMTETVIGKASPGLSASAPSSGTAGTNVDASSISAGLSAGASPSGSVTFRVFGPQASAPTDCSGGTTVGTASVSGNGSYSPSAGFTPSSAGDYWWYASYGGDPNNNQAASTCGAGMTETVVGKASPSLTVVSAPSSATAGTPIAGSSISGSLSGGASPSGTITFKVFGPQSVAPTSCTSGGSTVGTATVSANGPYSPSSGFLPTAAGDYWWYASSGGDPNNNPAASVCGASMAVTVVAAATRVPSAPVLSRLSVSPRELSLSGRPVGGRCVKQNNKNEGHKHCRLEIKLKVAYTLNVQATVTFALTQKLPGRMVTSGCVGQTKHNKHHKHCTRSVNLRGTITTTGSAGSDSFTFNGKLAGKRLRPGVYQLTATPSAAGKLGTPSSATFTIVA
jgi:hypothetical protein